MSDKTKQSQKSGDNSTNLQAQNLIVNQGLSYGDVKEIALDIFNTNFLELSQEALQTAVKRAEEITNKFIEKLKIEKPGTIDAVKDPGFQYALFEAQKSYAKTGDKDMSDVLIDVLVDRVEHGERDLRQIVLDECISVIPKLTSSQLDTLTIVFLLKYTRNFNIGDFSSLKQYLEVYIKPFVDNLSKEQSLFQHLQFAGCGSLSIGSSKIEAIYKKTYRGLFFQGFDQAAFEAQVGDFEKYGATTTKCLNDDQKLQINAIDEEALDKVAKDRNLDEDVSKKLKTMFNQNLMPDSVIKDKLIQLTDGFMKKLFDIWDNSAMKNMTLTSVGIAIAQANFRRKTGITLDLSVWIK
ncbi:hypothetical protein KKG19_04575 [Patescibacteria group bacterium]|nr:hypothetical protein [Patescibacteria group bacterium]